jgi:hypothetical protein
MFAKRLYFLAAALCSFTTGCKDIHDIGPAPAAGAGLDVRFWGLESGLRGRIDLLGPNGFNRTFVGDTLLTGLPHGRYIWSVPDVMGGPIGHIYGADPAAGSFDLTGERDFSLSVRYERKTGQLDFEASGVDTANGPFAIVTGPYDTHTMLNPRLSIALRPARYSWEARRLDPDGFDYAPADTAGAFDLDVQMPFRLKLDYAPRRGRVDLRLPDAPADTRLPAELTAPDGTTRDIELPETFFGEPGRWSLRASQSLIERKQDGVVEILEAQESTLDFQVNPGRITQLTIPLRLKSSYSDYEGPVNIKYNPFSHPIGLTSPAQWRVEWVSETTETEKVTISGPTPWVTVTGVRQSDGSLTATGAGDVAGYPNVSVTFTGWLKNGTLIGDYQMGKDTAPTGLPGGSITFGVSAVRVKN